VSHRHKSDLYLSFETIPLRRSALFDKRPERQPRFQPESTARSPNHTFGNTTATPQQHGSDSPDACPVALNDIARRPRLIVCHVAVWFCDRAAWNRNSATKGSVKENFSVSDHRIES